MKTKIITSIYSNLYGTDLGGRPSRGSHYRYSLKTLLNMTDADFICYTSEDEINNLKEFFYEQSKVSQEKLILKSFDLRNFSLTQKINRIKNIDETKNSDRCIEIQYSKFLWSLTECINNKNNYDYIFWIDAGLSHSGLFPYRYMNPNDNYWSQNYECILFHNQFLNNLIQFTEDKIFIFAKENCMNFWSQTVPNKYYNNHCMERHIIGGLFGGKTNNMINYCNLFLNYLHTLLDNELNTLYFEEHIMSLIFYNHPELFKAKFFDIWWHEDDNIPGLDLKEYTSTRKSFYKMIEELQ